MRPPTLEPLPSSNREPGRIRATFDGATFGDALRELERGAASPAWLVEPLRSAPFDAFFWECPPFDRTTIERPFEFVLVDAPALATRAPEPEVFAEHFARSPGASIVSFASLGRDAELIVPTPLTEPGTYVHLASFVRHAPSEQAEALWPAVARRALARHSDEPLWISTSGMGVSWLHVRLDSRPKYYTHAPYRSDPR